MVKFDCAICFKKFTRKNLHSLCNTCTGSDKKSCSSCLGKMVEIRGIHIDSPALNITIKCPWCRQLIPQSQIIQNRFSKTYQYYKAIYYQHALATQLLLMDRTDLREAVWHYQHAAEVATDVFNAWYAQRRLRPTRLELRIQAQYHNGASEAARARTGQPQPRDGSHWDVDTGDIDQ